MYHYEKCQFHALKFKNNLKSKSFVRYKVSSISYAEAVKVAHSFVCFCQAFVAGKRLTPLWRYYSRAIFEKPNTDYPF